MASLHSDICILAVEDAPLYAEGVELLLTELGYNNHSITDNAIEALRLFKQQPPDLLLMDMEIGGPLNGIAFVEIVSAIRKTPVIYITAFSDAETFDKVKQTGPSAYLIKPCNAKNIELAMELTLFQNSHEAIGEEDGTGLIKLMLLTTLFLSNATIGASPEFKKLFL